MTAAQLLDRLRNRGVTLFVEGNRLRYRAVPGAYPLELRQAVAEHRVELVSLLTGDERADAELSKALAVIDDALSATWLTQSQRNVLAVFRQQVTDYHAQSNPFLFGSDAWIERLVNRWRAELEEAIRRRLSRYPSHQRKETGRQVS